MDDKTLLERAARAAEHEPARWTDDSSALLLAGIQEPWNPLAGDGAFRLACDLCIDLDWSNEGEVQAYRSGFNASTEEIAITTEPHDGTSDGKRAAAKRAIVRAAAAMTEGEK